MITFKNIHSTIYPIYGYNKKDRSGIINHNLKAYNLEVGFTGKPKGFKPRKPITNIIGNTRNFGDFTDRNLLKTCGSGKLRDIARILKIAPVNEKIKFIGYDKEYCIVYKAVINGSINYHYRYKKMKRREDLPIDYYYISVDNSGLLQAITPRNLIKFISTVIKYQ